MADQAGFSTFVRDSSRALLRTAWLLTGNWASAEDLVQAALAKTWKRWESIDPDTAPAYVRRVMLTTFLRWRARHWSAELPAASVPEAAAPDIAFDQVELRVVLASALLGLPRRQRAVVVLRYFDDLSEARTAEVLGCSVGTVKSHSSRALTALRQVPALSPMVEERTEQ